MKKILQTLRENLNAQLTALSGQTGKDAEALRAGITQQLAGLAELDKLPENDVNQALVDLVRKQHEHATGLMACFLTASGDLAKANAKVAEFDGKVTSGDLVDKVKVTERCDIARREGIESCQVEIANLRKQAVTDLPVPPETVLKLPAAEFASYVEDAKANLATGKAKGLELKGKGDKFLSRAVWLKKGEFATELAGMEADGLLGGKAADLLMTPPRKDGETAPERAYRGVGIC